MSPSAPTTLVRDEIESRYKWNLADIHADWDTWEASYTELEGRITTLASYQGSLGDSAESLLRALREHDELESLSHRVWWYPSLMHDQDVRRNDVEERKQKVALLLARASTETAWLRPEMLAIGEEKVLRWLGENEELKLYRFLLEDLFRQQEHVLDPARETLLSYATPLSGAPRDAYSMLSTADIQWPTVTMSDGKEVKVTYAAYHRILSTAEKQEDRQTAFEALYETFAANRNTYAALYGAVCHRDWFHARSRGYDSTLEAALHGDDIPTSVVENLVTATREGSEPLRRYYRLRKKVLGLDEFHLFDAFTPLVKTDQHYPYAEAVQHVLASIEPLGDSYGTKMRRAFDERWIDVYENEGKRSGAYSAPVYGVHPYMLLNYQDTRNDMFTLAHEMGHSMHTVLSHETQPFVYAHYTIFVAEVASTLNEALLLDHLLEHTEDPRERVLLVQHAIDSIASTFYTQVLFADFELQAHRKVEAGEPVTAETLEGIYGELMQTYYGDAAAADPLYRLTWARIPHIYRTPYYVYQYATCFASAATLKEAICEGDERSRKAALARYHELLSAGGNAHPMDQLRRAGVDLGQPQTVAAVVARMDSLVTRLETELSALDS